MSAPSPDARFKYLLDYWPPPGPSAILSLQWLVILVPGLLVLGDVVALAAGFTPHQTVAFLQRLFLVCAAAQAMQILAGHRLPGLVGSSAVLMVGAIATVEGGVAEAFGSMALAGALTAVVGASGLIGRIRWIYTPPVLATTLLLLVMTFAPTMRDLMFHPASKGGGAASFLFALGLVLFMLWGNRAFGGLLASAMLLLGMALGSLVFHLASLGPLPPGLETGLAFGFPKLMPHALALDPGMVTAFIFCYLAVISNEMATVEAVGQIIQAPAMDSRLNRAVAVTGLGGVLAGLMGAPGTVTYAVSPGVVVSTASASRFTLLPAAGMLFLLGLWPQGLALFKLVPAPVVGASLFFVMATTVFAAMRLLLAPGQDAGWREGMVVGCAMTAGLVTAIMPPEVKVALPPWVRPILGNGFVVGLSMALILEHILLRKRAGRG